MQAASMRSSTGSARASTSGRSSTARNNHLVVRASSSADGFCRDKVNAPKAAPVSKGVVFKVSFLGMNDQSVTIDCPDDSYILDAADKAGVDLPATCRGGICGACVGRVASGSVDMSDIDDLAFTVSEDEQAQGMALLCMARPTSDVAIETQCDWGYSLGVAEWKGASGRFSATPEPLMGGGGGSK